MDLKLKDKLAVVTGGAAGIGAGCAKALAAEGCNVVVADRDGEAAMVFADQLEKEYKVHAYPISVDVLKKEEIAQMFDEIEKLGGADILVNNAGGGWKTPSFQEISDDDWKRSFDLVLNSAFYASRAFANQCIDKEREGAIVNMLSKSAVMSSSKNNAPYASSKGGMIAMTRAMAKDLIGYKIRVNGVVPGYVQTEKTYPESDPNTAVKRRMLPAGDFAKPDDIGTLVTFLASPRSYQMIGAVVDITGGTLI